MGSWLHFAPRSAPACSRASSPLANPVDLPVDDMAKAASRFPARALAPLAAVLAAVLVVLSLGGGRVPHASSSGIVALRTGCETDTTTAVTDAPAAGGRVALTFDDGPSAYTPEVLRALRHEDAQATFFVIGSQVAGHEGVLRRMVRDGHEIGNHSMLHGVDPDENDLAQASDEIQRASGFRPCQFRPPGGTFSDELVQRAALLGMGTVLWSVDPQDWVAQEPESIIERVLAVTEPGSIILLHDAGGDRTATAQIVEPLTRGLRDRGYELVTVTKLLGGHFTVGGE